MKKIFAFILLLIITNPIYAKSQKDDNFDDFQKLGRYIQTFETNDMNEEIETVNEKESPDDFEINAINDVINRYNEHAIELKLNESSNDVLQNLNKERIYKIRINEDKYNIEENIRNENMIWDSSKAFSNAFINGTKYMPPIPSVINSSKLVTSNNSNFSAEIGQTYLYDALGTSALFISVNESKYNTGSVLSYRGNGLNLSVGTFSSSINYNPSGGAVLSTKSIALPFNTGSFKFGGGIFANDFDTYNKYTTGGFAEYKYKRLKLNAQVAGSRNSNNTHSNTGVYLIPEIQLTESLYLKTKFIKNLTDETMQDEVGLSFRPQNRNNFEFEINTSNQYMQNENTNRRFKLSASFKF